MRMGVLLPARQRYQTVRGFVKKAHRLVRPMTIGPSAHPARSLTLAGLPALSPRQSL
jgi:hypothetical protein